MNYYKTDQNILRYKLFFQTILVDLNASLTSNDHITR